MSTTGKWKEMNTESFIKEASDIHGGKYDYSESIYTDSCTPITIICPAHGVFYKKAQSHIRDVRGCPLCARELSVIKKSKSNSQFIEEARNVHGETYLYDKCVYVNSYSDVIITCRKHGDFMQNTNSHISGYGCYLCGKESTGIKHTKTLDQFIEKAILVHGNKYGYLNSVYISGRNKIIITCPIHGDFMQTPSAHVAGYGCWQCGNDQNSFVRDKWVKRHENKVASFYILRCFNDNESFYKYGITSKSIHNRYSGKVSMPYSYEIVRLIISTDKEYIWDLEKRFGMFKRNDRYNPTIKFKGSKFECFNTYTYKKEKQE